MTDQLIVTKLRPMSEHSVIGESVLLCIRGEFIEGWLENDGNYWIDDYLFYTEDELEGWIPMPKYQPEKP